MLITRHIKHFNPDNVHGTVTICGCGAIGSRIAQELVRLGVNDIRVYDFDEVSELNISNQAFSMPDIGLPKVEAFAKWARENETTVDHINGHLTNREPCTEYLFMCADNMDVRREITKLWTHSNVNKAVIETRMSYDEVRVYTVRGIREYEEWLKVSNYEQQESEESVCGSKSSVGPTAGIAAMIAVHQFINIINERDVSQEIIFQTNPMDMITTTW